MNTREHFKKQGLGLDWGKNKVVIEVGREKDRIVCSPKAFRYLKRAIQKLNDIGYVDPILEGELIDAEVHKSTPKKGRRNGSVRETQSTTLEELRAIYTPNVNYKQFNLDECEDPRSGWPEYDDDGNLIEDET